jgi:signal transduction histidine kinase
VQVSFAAINDKNERSAGFVGVIRDVSEEKKLERMKEDLIGMITHDLRNPVLSLERVLQLVVNGTLGPLNDKQQKVMEQALVTSHQLYGMVSDILDIYRNENGKLVLRQVPTTIQQILGDSLKQVDLFAREKRLVLEFEPPLMPLPVMVDQARVRRTCVNLLDNAIKYSPEDGRICVRVRVLEAGEDYPGRPWEDAGDTAGSRAGQEMLLVSVEDEGIGIPEIYQQCIFDKYFTIKSNGGTCRGGVGLGLAFCKLVTEAHGGRIWVESPLHDGVTGFRAGCRFYFTLPFDCWKPVH